MNDNPYFFNHELNNPEQFNYRIFAPDYKAEILYWFSRNDIPKQQKEDFIRALVNFDDDCGGFYRYRAYLLAAEALNYFPESSFGDAIVKQLLDWSYIYFGWQLFPQPLVEAARNTLQVTDKKRVIKAFECLLRNTPSRITLQSAATKLGELDAGNKMAIAALILLLEVTTDNYKLKSICKSIAKIGAGNQTAITTVVKLMETTEDKNLCCEAIKTLGKIGCGNQIAILALEKFLQINRGDRICVDAAKALLLIDSGNEVAKDALVYILESTASKTTDIFYLLGEVAALLLQLKPEIQQEVISTLKNKIETGWDVYLVYGIDSSLDDFNFVSEVVITTLIDLMENTLEKYICANSIDILKKIGSNKSLCLNMQQLLIDSLERFLQKNRWDDICLDAAEALWKINPENQFAVLTLVEILEIHRSCNIRYKASYILLLTDKYYETAMQSLDEIASSDDEYEFYIPRFCVMELTSNQIGMKSLAVKRLLEKVIVKEVTSFQFDKKSTESEDVFQYDDSSLLYVADYLKKILQQEHFPQIITALKEYLGEKFYKNSSYRYESAYKLMWHCAENMRYQEFYKAWHS
ncbi:MAG: hypothetical protein WBA41_20270 [Rivularia sp. (in: cyanobacteria)]